jgi:hypothetical protein
MQIIANVLLKEMLRIFAYKLLVKKEWIKMQNADTQNFPNKQFINIPGNLHL